MMRLPAAAAAASNSSASTPKVEADSFSFILKVQHLIERCLMLYLDQDECVKALHKHAQIDPIITTTVWKELEIANMHFFQWYHCERIAREHASFDRVVEDISMKLSRQSLEDTTNKVLKKRPNY